MDMERSIGDVVDRLSVRIESVLGERIPCELRNALFAEVGAALAEEVEACAQILDLHLGSGFRCALPSKGVPAVVRERREAYEKEMKASQAVFAVSAVA